MGDVGIVALVLVVCAVLVLVAAEWPRLSQRFGLDARRARTRRRRKQRFEVIQGEERAGDDFAESVERDLANLPVIEERDDRSHRS